MTELRDMELTNNSTILNRVFDKLKLYFSNPCKLDDSFQLSDLL